MTSGEESKVVQYPRECFTIAYYPLVNHLFQFLAFERPADNLFVYLRTGFSFRQAFGGQNKHSFLQKTRRRKKVQKNMKGRRPASGLLDQFARGSFPSAFSLIDPPRHHV